MYRRLGSQIAEQTADGSYGFTAAQVARLLNCSEKTARTRCSGTLLGRAGARLAPFDDIAAARAALLGLLHAREIDDHPFTPDVTALASRVAVLEDRLRVLTAARFAANQTDSELFAAMTKDIPGV